ncbi:hypothetical protein Sbs19_41570 [Sphingobium sp. BS19]|nr:hypothetical protein Sbs19_41570 [Sphingobium sp. BS19]
MPSTLGSAIFGGRYGPDEGKAAYLPVKLGGIPPEALLYLQGQGSHALPHIGMPGRDPYPDAEGNWDHDLIDRSTIDTRLVEPRRRGRPPKNGGTEQNT